MNSTIAPAGSDAPSRTLRVGTRGSALALLQAHLVVDRLRARHPDLECDVRIVSTQGDRDKETPLAVIGGQGVFAKELEASILAGDIDCAVHSLKDLPSLLPKNLILAAILERDDPRDVLISRHPGGLAGLPRGARVGTSSRRRVAQLMDARPDAETIELRGNVDTRLSKVLADESPYDAAILAAAGVIRMERSSEVAEFLDVGVFTPAPGQAALAVECREDDMATRALLAAVHDDRLAALAGVERAFLRGVGGGCRSPIGAYAEWQGGRIRLRAMVAGEDLTRVERLDQLLDPEVADLRAEEIAAGMIAMVTE